MTLTSKVTETGWMTVASSTVFSLRTYLLKHFFHVKHVRCVLNCNVDICRSQVTGPLWPREFQEV
jgi:hypothetical protein